MFCARKGLLLPKFGVCHVGLQNHLFPGHGPKLYIPCQVLETETKVVLTGFSPLLVNSYPKVVACCFPHTLCSDWQKTDLGSMVSLSRFLPFCWLMLLAKSSVHLGGSSQGPQIAGRFAEHWPDLHGFLAAYGGIGFALAWISCYSLLNIFF